MARTIEGQHKKNDPSPLLQLVRHIAEICINSGVVLGLVPRTQGYEAECMQQIPRPSQDTVSATLGPGNKSQGDEAVDSLRSQFGSATTEP